MVERATHRHLLAIILTEARSRFPDGAMVRVLDAGCGNGHLIADLHRALSTLDPSRRYEFYGFDVHDWEYLGPDTATVGLRELNTAVPDIAWDGRIARIATTDAWPWPEGFFDVIVSNQVVEHVADHAFFFAQVRRVLSAYGFSVHLFPPGQTVFEVHLRMPFVHWPRTTERRAWLIRLFAPLTGRFRRYRSETGKDLNVFVAENALYLERFTNYRSTGGIARLAQNAGLRADYGYTAGLYGAFVRNRKGQPLGETYYRPGTATAGEPALMALLRHVSCVTLFLVPGAS
jgi:SAM-dependent methyltransferase